MIVYVQKSPYIPYGLKIWFDADGAAHQDAELIDVCESEFKKDEMYLAKINELTSTIENLEKENSEILNSNSWKITKNFRKIGKKFK